jgi:hypothetical protein
VALLGVSIPMLVVARRRLPVGAKELVVAIEVELPEAGTAANCR